MTVTSYYVIRIYMRVRDPSCFVVGMKIVSESPFEGVISTTERKEI